MPIVLHTILAIVALATAATCFSGDMSPPTTVSPWQVSMFSSDRGCQQASAATGTPDWDTACSLSEDVTNCYHPAGSPLAPPYCEIWYLCKGWVPEPADPAPRLELSFTPTTAVTRVRIHEQGARGWINKVTLLADDGFQQVVFESATPQMPSESYKPSPPQRAGGAYFAPGIDYRGGTNVTVSGAPCMSWTLQNAIPWSPTTGVGWHNFCRNPNNDPQGPWCFVQVESAAFVEYCSIPRADGCDDSPLTIAFPEPTLKTFSRVRIEMRPNAFAMTAIDAVSIEGSMAMGCFFNQTYGFFKWPHCDVCQEPYKGRFCNETTCGDGSPCINGYCDSSNTCVCFPGFFGADCAQLCPTPQPFQVGMSPSAVSLELICNGHGTCFDGRAGNGTCQCDVSYAGSSCGISCPRDTNNNVCSNNGTCSDGATGTGTCTCSGDAYGVDCSLQPCNGFRCYNGECVDNKCVCHRSSARGYWAGVDCNSCDSKYSGASCTNRIVTVKTINGVLTSEDGDGYTFVALPRTVASATLQYTGNSVDDLVEVSVGEGIEPLGCTAFLDSASPSVTCTVDLSIIASYTLGDDQRFSIRIMPSLQLARFGISSFNMPYTISVTYDPSCSVSCEPHGYCGSDGDDSEEGFTDPFGYLFNGHNKRQLQSIPTVTVDSVTPGLNSVTLEISFDGSGVFAAAAVDSGALPSDLNYVNPGDVVIDELYSVARASTLMNAARTQSIVLHGLAEATTYDIYYETGDVAFSSFTTLNGPVSVTTNSYPVATIASSRIFGSSMSFDLSLNYAGNACLCAVDSSSTVAICDYMAICSTETAGLTSVTLTVRPLVADTAYEVYVQTTVPDVPDPSSWTSLGSFTTVQYPECSSSFVAVESGTSISFNCAMPMASGHIYAVILPVDDAVPSAATIKASPSFNTALSLATDATSSVTALTAATNYKIAFVLETPAAQLSPVYEPIYFSTPGAVSISVEAANVRGTTVDIRLTSSLGGFYTVAVRYSSNPALTIADMESDFTAAPTVYFHQGVVAVKSGGTPITIAVTGLVPKEELVAYVAVVDALGENYDLASVTFTTTLDGVTSCDEYDFGGSPVCTPNAFYDFFDSRCRCHSGFTCVSSLGECLTTDAALLIDAEQGTCQCDANAVDGFWNGTSCSSCLPPYFGSECKNKCYRGELNTARTACICPASTKFEGLECSVCPPHLGFYGENCNVSSQLVGVTTAISLRPNAHTVLGMYRAMVYSPLTVTLRIADDTNTISAIASLTLLTYASYSDSIHQKLDAADDAGFSACLGDGSSGESAVAPNSSLACHSLDSWKPGESVVQCTTIIPAGSHFFAINISAASLVDLEVTIDVASGCCNSNGLCGNYTDDCTCASDSRNGFYDDRDSCASCRPGYAGERCNVVSEPRTFATTGQRSINIGESEWFSIRIEPNMPVEVALQANVDCDLSVKLQSRCHDGWTHFAGRCYRIFTNECISISTAATRCSNEGGRLALARSVPHLDFFSRLMEDSGILSDRQSSSLCSRKVAVGNRRMKPPCVSSNSTRPKNETECAAFPTECEWSFGDCTVKDTSNCVGAMDENDCHYDSITSERKRCEWIELGSNNYEQTCLPTWDNADNWEEFNDALASPERDSYLRKNPCDQYTDEESCMNQIACLWSTFSVSCFPDYTGAASEAASDLPMYDSNFFKTQYACASILPSIDGTKAIWVPTPCTDSAKTERTASRNLRQSTASPYQLYMCERDDTSVASEISGTSIQPVAADTRRIANPTCEGLSTSVAETCSLFSTAKQNLLVARVACLEQGSYVANFTFVRQRRTLNDDPRSSNCTNSVTGGSFAGTICTRCAPRFSGTDCTVFRSCVTNPGECGSHGTCNSATGYCTCNAEYFGELCDTRCTASTCGTGSCDTNFQKCAGPGPIANTSRPCAWSEVCKCPDNLDGPTCNSCKFGFWGVGTCTSACNCNDQPCHAQNGTCQCHDDDRRGHWTGATCNTCKANYFGVRCTDFCTRAATCSGNGNCTDNGGCVCESGFFGTACSLRCDSTTCTRGTCGSTGMCVCHASFSQGFWAGERCQTCAAGFWGTSCANECVCNARGSCARDTGKCTCFDDAVLGHFSGDRCDSCKAGWVGESCTTPDQSVNNAIGVAYRASVGASARLVKDTTSTGASFLHTAANGTRSLYAATGTQLALFSGTDVLQFVGACDLRAILSYGLNFVDSFASRDGYVYFVLQGSSRSFLIPILLSAPPITAANGCNFTSTDAITLWDSKLSTSDAENYAHVAVGAVFEPVLQVAYVAFRRDDVGDRKIVAVGRVNVSSLAEAKKAFTETLYLEQFGSVTSMAIQTGVANPAIFIAGTDLQSSVQIAKIFVATPTIATLRATLEFQPFFCKQAVCTRIARVVHVGGLLVAAVDTSDRGVVLLTLDLDGDTIKAFESHYRSVDVLSGSSGCGFIAYDPYAQFLYVAVGRSQKPSVVAKFSFPSLTLSRSSLALLFGQTSAEFEVAAAAALDVNARELLIVNKLTRSNILSATLVEVTSVFPIVVDSGGGSRVNVTGTGFRDLGASILCKFGTRVNQQLRATFISSTLVQCQAPLVTSFDPCEDVALEISLSGLDRFTANSVMIKHVNRPNVAAIYPSNRGTLVPAQPITVSGTGFQNTPYLLCNVAGVDVPATYVSTTAVTCAVPPRATPLQTVIEVSLDGQKFSSNSVPYYIVGLPTEMRATWTGLTENVYSVNADHVVVLRELRVVFFDAAGTSIADADFALRNSTVRVSLSTSVSSPLGSGFGVLEGNTTARVVEGVASFGGLSIRAPGRGSYAVNVTVDYATIPAISMTFEVKAVESRLVFSGAYSKFTTSKRRLDEQPVVRLVDVVGNTVISFSGDITIQAHVIPTPPCLSGTGDDCQRVSGNLAQVVNGIATFSTLWFRGELGTNYTLKFNTTDSRSIAPLFSEVIYAADCPASNAFMSAIIPPWITMSVGGTVTVKGWDFQVTQILVLRAGPVEVPCAYVDTCTCVAYIAPVVEANASAVETPSFRRFAALSALSSPSTLQLSLVDKFSQQESAPTTFVIKNSVATHVGFSEELYAETIASIRDRTYVGAQNTTVLMLQSNATAKACKDTTKSYCYTAVERTYLFPIPIVLEDVAGGEIFDGNGWSDASNNDVTVTVELVSWPAENNRAAPQILFGGEFQNLTTVRGVAFATNLYLDRPRAGDYVLSFTTRSLRSRNVTITIEKGPAVALSVVLRNMRQEAAYDAPVVERGEGDAMDLILYLRDINGNPLALEDVPHSLVTARATIQPVQVVHPPPLANTTLPENVTATLYGGTSASSAASMNPSIVTLSSSFDFSTATLSGIWFGVVYRVTISFAPDVTDGSSIKFYLRRSNCPSVSDYGANFTTECRTPGAGGLVSPTNGSLYLYAAPGYWRASYQDAIFYECEASNCLGGFWSDCREGATGPLCAVCLPGYGKQGVECLRCPSRSYNVTIMVLFVLGMLAMVTIMVRANLDSTVKPKSTFSIIVKILMTHLQTAALMSDFQTRVKGIVKDLADAQDKATPDTSFVSFSCVSGWDMYSFFVMWMILPVFVVTIPALIALLVRAKQSMSYRSKLRRAEAALLEVRAAGGDDTVHVMHLEALQTRTLPPSLENFDMTQPEYVSPPLSDNEIEDQITEERQIESGALNPLGPKRQRVLAANQVKLAQELQHARSILAAPQAEQQLRIDAQDFVDAVTEGRHDEIPVPGSFDEYTSRTTGLPFWVHRETGVGQWLRPSFMRFRGERAKEVLQKYLGAAAVGGDAAATTTGDAEMDAIDIIEKRKVVAANADEDMARCSICAGDSAIFTCKQCSADGSFVPYCEMCWRVIHSAESKKHDHVQVFYRTNDELETAKETEAEAVAEGAAALKLQIVEDVRELRSAQPPMTVYTVTVLVTIFLIYPHLITQISSVLKCKDFPTMGKSLLEIDMTLECDTPTHDRYKAAAQVLFVVYGIGIPLAGALVLYTRRNRLLHRDTLASLGFLYSGYTLRAYLWEFVIIARKAAVVCVVVYFEGDVNFRILFGLWIVSVAFILNIFVRPFQLRIYWVLENIALASVVISLNLSLLYQPQFALSVASDSAVTSVIFVVNLSVLVAFAYYLLYGVRQDLIKALDVDGNGTLTFGEFVRGIKNMIVVSLRKAGVMKPDAAAAEKSKLGRRRSTVVRGKLGVGASQRSSSSTPPTGLDGPPLRESSSSTPVPGAHALAEDNGHLSDVHDSEA